MEGPSKLVVLCDDMWCSAKTASETNLRLLARFVGINFEARGDSIHGDRLQARYFPGPGLGTAFDLVVSGEIGDSIATRCVDIYEYIANNFTESHELWMFGAGRGAYVIRCVAGMIDKCGIVRVKQGVNLETRMLAHGAYTMYASQAGNLPAISRFKTTSSWVLVERPIKFIGLFDTTGPKRFAPISFAVESTWSLPPPCDDFDLSRVAEHVYHAVAIHERLPLFNFYPLPPSDDGEKQTSGSRNVHEKWFPGMHYDLARQEFSFQPAGGITNMPSFFWPFGERVRPNALIADLVLRWMLEKIQAVDSSKSLGPGSNWWRAELPWALTSCKRSMGSGDIYGSILEYTPLAPLRLWWNWLPGCLTQPLAEANRRWLEFVLGLEDRKIPRVSAETYDYKKPFDQSGDTIERLAQLSRERYPSNAYDDFQLLRCLMGETDEQTFLCLTGKEHDPRPQPSGGLGAGGHMVLDISWQGPAFYKLYRGDRAKVDWDRVLTITKASADGEYYIARSVSAFLSEFYGDLGVSLLEWVEKLCRFKTRQIPREKITEILKKKTREMPKEKAGDIPKEEKTKEGFQSASAACSPDTLDRVHLHVSEDSITACFEDDELDWKIPATSSYKIDRALSALRWVVSVFQSLEGTPGIFRVGCLVDDSSNRKSWLPSREPFKAGKEESSCWMRLFDAACVAEMPPSLHFDVGKRSEGLEVRWDQLMELTRVSRFWHTETGVVLFGADIALAQLAPVESRRWHVVRTPGELISPLHVEKGITSSRHPVTLRQELEFWDLLSAGSTGPREGAIESWVKRGHETQERKLDLEEFSYQEGMVYVGWCSEPSVVLGSQRPSQALLRTLDQRSGVLAVTNNIISLANVNTARVWNIAATFQVLGVGLTGNFGQQYGKQGNVQPLAVGLRSNELFCEQLQHISLTPCILWDDTLKRAWLVPGTCALLFVSLCYFARLGLTFNGDIQYATPSNDAAASATRCIERNEALVLTNQNVPAGTTFGHLVLWQWQNMQEAQTVCRSTTTNSKHVRPGVVFGYDLYDMLGPGRVVLRCLDERRAGRNLRGWEPLAQEDATQVIFCKSIGPVIQCVSEACPGAPCQAFCDDSATGRAQGVLACLLQDFKRFFEQDWDQYPQTSRLLVGTGFEWVPRGRDPFGHVERPPHQPGTPCRCCEQLGRLQAIIPARHESAFTRCFRRWVRQCVEKSDIFTNAMWLDQPLAVRFGLVS